MGLQVRHPPGHEVRRQAWSVREVELRDDAPDSTIPGPEAIAEAKDLAQAVRLAMHVALTGYQRRIAVAVLVDDVPIDVLADRLGTTRGALYKTLHVAVPAAGASRGERAPSAESHPSRRIMSNNRTHLSDEAVRALTLSTEPGSPARTASTLGRVRRAGSLRSGTSAMERCSSTCCVPSLRRGGGVPRGAGRRQEQLWGLTETRTPASPHRAAGWGDGARKQVQDLAHVGAAVAPARGFGS